MEWLERTDLMLSSIRNIFGESATYYPVIGGPYSITGVFDAKYSSIDPQTGVPVISTEPIVFVKLSDCQQDPTVGDSIEIRRTMFRVMELQRDGQGGASLRLHKRS